LSTTVLQGRVATWVNNGGIFNDSFIASFLLSVTLKEFWRSVRIWQNYGKKSSGTFFRTRCILNYRYYYYYAATAAAAACPLVPAVDPQYDCRQWWCLLHGWTTSTFLYCKVTTLCTVYSSGSYGSGGRCEPFFELSQRPRDDRTPPG